MGRLEKIFDSNDPNPHYQYWYDRSSNVTKRRIYLNGTEQRFVPDEINRIKERTIQAVWYENYPNGRHDYDFSREAYGYDPLSRVKTTDRTLRAPDGTTQVRRDGFGYNDAGELTSAGYDRVPNGQGGFGPAERWVTYKLDLAGNRYDPDAVNEKGTWTSYTPNNLNQYTSVGGAALQHGAQHELTKYQEVNYRYLADGQLATVSRSLTDRYELGHDALGPTGGARPTGRPSTTSTTGRVPSWNTARGAA